MALDFVTLSLLAAVGFAAGNVLDKTLMTRFLDHGAVRVFWYNLFAPVIVAPALLTGRVASLPPAQVAVAFLAGVVLSVSGILLMRAMQEGEVSRLALIIQTSPLFALIFSMILLGEVLAPAQYAGIAVLVVAAILASLDHPAAGLPAFSFNRPFRYALAATVFFALSAVLLKYLLQFTTFWTAFYWQQVGMFLFAPFLLCSGDIRREALSLPRRSRAGITVAAGSAVAYVGANLAFTAAMEQVSAAIVAAIVTINPLFVLGIVMALTRLGAQQFEEHLTRVEVVVKTAATLLFVAGIYLVK